MEATHPNLYGLFLSSVSQGMFSHADFSTLSKGQQPSVGGLYQQASAVHRVRRNWSSLLHFYQLLLHASGAFPSANVCLWTVSGAKPLPAWFSLHLGRMHVVLVSVRHSLS